MISNRKEFLIGLSMMTAFSAVLVGMFLPLFGGKNGLDAMDDLYNSISKASADYIPQLIQETARHAGTPLDLTLDLDDAEQVKHAERLLKDAGALVFVSGTQLEVNGDLGAVLGACLRDAAEMFRNQGGAVSGRYGVGERTVLFTWWKVLQGMERQMNKEKLFSQAKFVSSVEKRGVECAYNYYGIEPQKISGKAWTVVLSLVFYVVYTVWYGFGFLYLFQGLGLRLEH